MKLSLTKNSLAAIYFFAFTAILIYSLIGSVRTGYPKEGWLIADFLINYQGGFVRRGLPGELLFHLHAFTGVRPYAVILSSCLIAYAALILFFVKAFIAKGYPIFILPFVFFIGNPVISDFWVRKDVFLVLIFIATLYLSTRKQHPHLIALNLLLMLGLLMHESIGFFGIPILGLLLMSRNSRRSLLRSGLQLSPALLTFGCVLYFKGTPQISQRIWDSWQPVAFPIQSEAIHQAPSAIDALSWPLNQGLALAVQTFNNFRDGIYAPLAWLIILLLVYYILTHTDRLDFKLLHYQPTKIFHKTNLSNTLLFQFVTVIPLFILGWDYGRWVFFWVTSSFSIMLLIPETELSALFPNMLSTLSRSTNKVLDAFFSQSRSFLFLLCILIGVPGVSWSVVSYINTISLVIVLRFFSEIIHDGILLLKALA